MQPPGSPNPFGAGGSSIMFAKRKRNIFKGPMLSFGGAGGAPGGSGTRSTNSGSHSRSASANGLGRRSGEITIEEEDEDDEFAVGESEVEEVDSFTPVVRGPGEQVEEIFEEDEDSIKTVRTKQNPPSSSDHAVASPNQPISPITLGEASVPGGRDVAS